jgi:hypothetical protein
MKPPLDMVWARIRQNQHQPFSTITGARFSYHVEGSTVVVDRTDYGIAKSNFERVLDVAPLESPTEISNTRGPGYVWAILHDKRIRRTDW